MRLDESTDEDEIYLFERVVVHLQSRHMYSQDDAVALVNGYYANFTDHTFCERFNIPVQSVEFFCHIEAVSMADRVHYYQGLGHTPDEQAFVEWQRRFEKLRD
ncbi:hypothetical protein RF679_00755 [Undibacterium cyanobacteriorum]|uniref:DUF4296 domain-containing protein n=1 Tax=Undibacterium cyanobacteriorum TaxID=3073561 RepID=A0ABY9RHZ5_9BURK|nr:hypothetical protein [Undibacterium sp. 20NA77.5]WMW80825.1 hypothetical protein RF679_00755 [Undibacterium sp. 20NA77.5]